MKKILTITLLVLLTVGLFVSCDGNAEETVFKNRTKELNPFKFVTTVVFKTELQDEITISKNNSASWLDTNYTVDYTESMSFNVNYIKFYKDENSTPIESFDDLLELDSIHYLTTFPNEVWHKCDKV